MVWIPEVLNRWSFNEAKKEIEKKYGKLNLCEKCTNNIIHREHKDFRQSMIIIFYATIVMGVLFIISILI